MANPDAFLTNPRIALIHSLAEMSESFNKILGSNERLWTQFSVRSYSVIMSDISTSFANIYIKFFNAFQVFSSLFFQIYFLYKIIIFAVFCIQIALLITIHRFMTLKALDYLFARSTNSQGEISLPHGLPMHQKVMTLSPRRKRKNTPK